MDVLIVVLKVAGVLLAIPAAYFLFLLLYFLGTCVYVAWERRQRDRWRAQVDAFWFGYQIAPWLKRRAARELLDEETFRAREKWLLEQDEEYVRARDEIARASFRGSGRSRSEVELRIEKLDLDKLPPHLREKVERLQRGEPVEVVSEGEDDEA